MDQKNTYNWLQLPLQESEVETYLDELFKHAKTNVWSKILRSHLKDENLKRLTQPQILNESEKDDK